MGLSIVNNKIGNDLYYAQDVIFENEALVNSGVKTSEEFLLAQTMGGTQVNIVAGELGCIIDSGKKLTISLITAPVSGGTFDDTIFSTVITGAKTYTKGEKIASVVPNRDINEMYTKLVITTDFNGSDDYVTAYQVGL